MTSPQSFAATALLVAIMLPSTSHAQEGIVEGALRADLLWSRLAGQDALLLGGRATLRVGSRVSIGGFGYGMPTSIRLVEGAVPEDLRLGYGGLVVELDLAPAGRLGVTSALLLGAGNAQVHAQPIGNQLGSDNFLIVEPRIGLTLPQRSRLNGKLGVGYRWVGGVQDLPRLDTPDLRGWTVSVSLAIGGLE